MTHESHKLGPQRFLLIIQVVLIVRIEILIRELVFPDLVVEVERLDYFLGDCEHNVHEVEGP